MSPARVVQFDANDLPHPLQVHILREHKPPCRGPTTAIMQIYNKAETDAP